MLWLAARDHRVPVLAKVIAAITAAYALSPIDLIPDFLPVIGYLDDLILVPLGIWVAVRLVPLPLLTDLRVKAASIAKRPASRAGTAGVIIVWIVCALALIKFLI